MRSARTGEVTIATKVVFLFKLAVVIMRYQTYSMISFVSKTPGRRYKVRVSSLPRTFSTDEPCTTSRCRRINRCAVLVGISIDFL